MCLCVSVFVVLCSYKRKRALLESDPRTLQLKAERITRAIRD